MGISFQNAQFILGASPATGVGSTLTIGRLQLFLSGREVADMEQRLGLGPTEVAACREPYADSFLKSVLGASEVTSLDYSAYEGASIVHDMNVPIPKHLEMLFDTVIDGGTLEHVFNFPVALANCMRLLKRGGSLFIFAPANNQMGHGFYQFSPELLYRALSPAHGFQVERMRAQEFRYVGLELGTRGPLLDVVDPAVLATRTVVTSGRPVGLFVHAIKAAHMERPFDQAPQQSDYVSTWTAKASDGAEQGSTWARIVASISWRLPPAVKWPIWNEYGRLYRNTLRNRRWFRPVLAPQPGPRQSARQEP